MTTAILAILVILYTKNKHREHYIMHSDNILRIYSHSSTVPTRILHTHTV